MNIAAHRPSSTSAFLPSAHHYPLQQHKQKHDDPYLETSIADTPVVVRHPPPALASSYHASHHLPRLAPDVPTDDCLDGYFNAPTPHNGHGPTVESLLTHDADADADGTYPSSSSSTPPSSYYYSTTATAPRMTPRHRHPSPSPQLPGSSREPRVRSDGLRESPQDALRRLGAGAGAATPDSGSGRESAPSRSAPSASGAGVEGKKGRGHAGGGTPGGGGGGGGGGSRKPLTFVMEGPGKGKSQPKKRTRLTTACEACRIRKVKCSLFQPCDSCRVSGMKCVFRDIESRPRPSNPHPRRPISHQTVSGSASTTSSRPVFAAPSSRTQASPVGPARTRPLASSWAEQGQPQPQPVAATAGPVHWSTQATPQSWSEDRLPDGRPQAHAHGSAVSSMDPHPGGAARTQARMPSTQELQQFPHRPSPYHPVPEDLNPMASLGKRKAVVEEEEEVGFVKAGQRPPPFERRGSDGGAVSGRRRSSLVEADPSAPYYPSMPPRYGASPFFPQLLAHPANRPTARPMAVGVPATVGPSSRERFDDPWKDRYDPRPFDTLPTSYTVTTPPSPHSRSILLPGHSHSHSGATVTAPMDSGSTPSATAGGQPPRPTVGQQHPPTTTRHVPVLFFRHFGPTAYTPGYRSIKVAVQQRDRSPISGGGGVGAGTPSEPRSSSRPASSPGSGFGFGSSATEHKMAPPGEGPVDGEGSSAGLQSRRNSDREPETRPRSPPETRRLFEPDLPRYPRRDHLEHLVKLFFEAFLGHFPWLDEEETMDEVRAGTLPAVLANAICALSCRFSTRTGLRRSPHWSAGEPYAEMAKLLLTPHLSWPSLEVLQALVLIAWSEHGCGRDSGVWQYSGMATRMAQDLGLHLETTLQLVPSPIERERTRLVFFSVVILDQLVSASTGRMATFSEYRITTKWPSQESLFAAQAGGDGAGEEGLEGAQEQEKGKAVGSRRADDGGAQNDDARATRLAAPIVVFSEVCRAALFRGRVNDLINGAKQAERDGQNDSLAYAQAELSKARTFLETEYAIPEQLGWAVVNFRTLKDQGQAGAFLLLHGLINDVRSILNRPSIISQFTPNAASPGNYDVDIARGACRLLVDMLTTGNLDEPFSVLATPWLDHFLLHCARAFLADREIANENRTEVLNVQALIEHQTSTASSQAGRDFSLSPGMISATLNTIEELLEKMAKYWASVGIVLRIYRQQFVGTLAFDPGVGNCGDGGQFTYLRDVELIHRWANKRWRSESEALYGPPRSSLPLGPAFAGPNTDPGPVQESPAPPTSASALTELGNTPTADARDEWDANGVGGAWISDAKAADPTGLPLGVTGAGADAWRDERCAPVPGETDGGGGETVPRQGEMSEGASQHYPPALSSFVEDVSNQGSVTVPAPTPASRLRSSTLPSFTTAPAFDLTACSAATAPAAYQHHTFYPTPPLHASFGGHSHTIHLAPSLQRKISDERGSSGGRGGGSDMGAVSNTSPTGSPLAGHVVR